MRISTVIGVAAGLAAGVSALPTIEVKGAKLFTSDGDQYFIKGIAYQLTPDDPLLDDEQCQRDAKLMSTIGTNAIRVYHVNGHQDHSACMKTFADNGIYLWVDLDTFSTQIDQEAPHWNETQLSAFQEVMDEFQQYDNTAGFFVGNEVLTTGNGSVAAPYVKAAARDTKAYRDAKHYRKIPIGYSAADIPSLRPMLQNYLACGSNESEALDFFSLNAYEWCGQSSYSVSGYDMLEKNVTDYNIPIFLSETGCNKPPPRTFDDQAAIFGQMADHWSGAIIYEWIQESNNYGLVSYGPFVDPAKNTNAPPDGYTRSGTPTPISPDFDNLSKQWKTLTPSGVKASEYTPSLTAPACPGYTADAWEVNGDVKLPSLGQTFDAAVQSSITHGTAGATAAASSSSSSGGAGMPQITMAPELKGAGLGLGFLAVGMALL
ncbi:hypothetical protein NA57DRAFT_61427 [Rhizodiscina lignyota]|uniref:1,3-beta-glucanosyltransferase n=1 Tax=Rhizodiscina lignyota TaxID=1504668 RepID=A0A9P4I793_9PEZI|nr:hypothetical protein NA57DRAFT_61427 [Rhizodiscina lignyota]